MLIIYLEASPQLCAYQTVQLVVAILLIPVVDHL